MHSSMTNKEHYDLNDLAYWLLKGDKGTVLVIADQGKVIYKKECIYKTPIEELAKWLEEEYEEQREI